MSIHPMNSLGPSRRSWSALHQRVPSDTTGSRKHASSDARRKPRPSSNHSRKLFQLRNLPLLIFSFAAFLYCTMIYLHMQIGRSTKKSSLRKRSRKNASTEVVHIIQTRFMQHQPSLLQLGQARLDLFETFCLPTVQHQVNTNFLWIIRTDPNLHPDLMGQLIDLVSDHPNYILLGSNFNPEGFGRGNDDDDGFSEFMRADGRNPVMSASVLSGNVTLVQEAFDKSNDGAILLETRLDADDGLHRDFVKTVQSEARHLAVEGEELWRIWCINYNVEWHPLNPFPVSEKTNGTLDEGYLVMYSDPNICVTPGLTFGYGSGASRSSIGERLRHDQITKKIKTCTPDSKNTTSNPVNVGCFSRLSELSPGAIRSRTTTSAGMDNVVTGNNLYDKKNKLAVLQRAKKKDVLQKFNQQYFAQDKLWAGLKVIFSIQRDKATRARKFIVENNQKIADDNLKGQCTPGHSCKNDTRSVLKSVSSRL